MSHMPLWLGPSLPVDPGAVERDGDADLVQRGVHEDLVEGPAGQRATATTGCRPVRARPAADTRACCSAIPTSKYAVGERGGEISRGRALPRTQPELSRLPGDHGRRIRC